MRARVTRDDRGEGLFHHFQVLFRGEAADVKAGHTVFRQTPTLAHGGIASAGMKQSGINAASHRTHVGNAARAQRGGQFRRRHEGGLAAPVQRVEPAGDRGHQPCQAVVAAVLIEVRVIAGGERQLAGARGADGGPAERAFGDHMHQVGALAIHQPAQAPPGRQAQAQAGVIGNGQAGHSPGVGSDAVVLLPRPHQADPVAARAQTVHQALRGHRDAVDFRWVGFGDEKDAQGLHR